MIKRLGIAVSFLLALAAATGDAVAARDYIYSDRGKLLPEWCKYTADGDWNPNHPYSRVFGARNWTHVHHYCRGLFKIDTAMVEWTDERRRNYRLAEALEEFDYVLRNTDARFHMRPEILVKKAHVLVLLGRDVQAIDQLGRVLEMRPDYVPAFMMLSNLFLRQGDRETAVEMLELGLQHIPGSDVLEKRLAEVRSGAGPRDPEEPGS